MNSDRKFLFENKFDAFIRRIDIFLCFCSVRRLCNTLYTPTVFNLKLSTRSYFVPFIFDLYTRAHTYNSTFHSETWARIFIIRPGQHMFARISQQFFFFLFFLLFPRRLIFVRATLTGQGFYEKAGVRPRSLKLVNDSRIQSTHVRTAIPYVRTEIDGHIPR